MQKEVGARGSQIRPHNRRLLLQLLRAGDQSRSELAQASGLSPAAVTNVVAELMAEGLVQERAPERVAGPRALGRPATRVALVRQGPVVLGVQIGAGLVQVGVIDLEGTVLERTQEPLSLPAAPGKAVATAIKLGRKVLKRRAVVGRTLIGIGIGAAGRVDEHQHVTLAELSLHDEPVADAFADVFGVPVIVDHNVRAMAIGESRYGVGRGLVALGFIYVRMGAGAGLIIDGKAFRFQGNGAAEFGHVRVAGDGPLCSCGGRGCLETFVSEAAITRQLVTAGLARDKDQSVAEVLLEQIAAGNPEALRVRDDLADRISTALVTVVNLLGPQVLVLGGLLDELSPVLAEGLEATVRHKVLPHLSDTVHIVPSAHGRDAGLVGAATVALDRFVFGENLLATHEVS